MRDYVGAVRACIRAFRREERLAHEGPYYNLSLLPGTWMPPRHDFEDVKIDISAVGPVMCRTAGELCDGLHVHPLHSIPYLRERLLPAVAEGAARTGRSADDVDLIVPIFAIAGDSHEELAPKIARTKAQIAFYGSTPNYAFQFDDLGFEGTGPKLNQLMRKGDIRGMAAVIDDAMLDAFALVGKWDDMADALIARYGDVAERVVLYLALDDIHASPTGLAQWGEVARAVRAA